MLLIAVASTMLAQQAPVADPAPAQTPAAAAAPATAAAPAAPEAEDKPSGPKTDDSSWLTGWIEVGYRWNTGPSGSLSTYRSIVNLGSGPKLIGTDFTITAPGQRLFDTIHVRASDWTDPYSTLNVFAEKERLYHFTASYRSLAYFNNLPSFADPLLAKGIQLNEQSFDSRRHLASMELRLLEQHRVSPYFAFDRDSNTGHGVSAFQTGDNEYAVPYTNTDLTNQFRGGVNIVLPRLHLTLEEGGTTWKSNQSSYATGLDVGNSTSQVLGQTLDLTLLQQAWGIRGSGAYSRAVLTATPLSWIDVYGHFGYSDPHNSVNYTQYDTGNMILLSQALFYNGEQFLLTAAARNPHTSADAGVEVRPLKRVRIDGHFLTDRTHNAGSSKDTDTLFANLAATPSASGISVLPAAFSSFLAANYNESETGVSVDVTSAIRVRGAYRYEWGDGNDLVLPQTGLLTIRNSQLRRNVGIGSVSWRMTSKLLLASDFEWGVSGSEYYRTSLYNYRKARLTGRYSISRTLRVSADYRILSNDNPLAGSPYKSLSHQESVAFQWTPPVKNSSFDAVYEHCGYNDQISYLDPTYLISGISTYREYCHDISATASFVFPKSFYSAKLTAGGSALLTSGSRPGTYYQPTVRVSVPFTKNLGWFAVWQYYGFGENYYTYENFQTNLFTTGLRFTK